MRSGRRSRLPLLLNDDTPHLHGCSGLARNFVPKAAFHAVAHLPASCRSSCGWRIESGPDIARSAATAFPLVPTLLLGNAAVLEALLPHAWLLGARSSRSRAAKQSFGDKGIPKQELGNEGDFVWLEG